jgi:hypothetical protein
MMDAFPAKGTVARQMGRRNPNPGETKMHSSSYLTSRATDQGHVLRTIGVCSPYAAHRLAAEERYAAAAAATARARLRREAGPAARCKQPRIAGLRTLVGTILIRIGEHMRGEPCGGNATRVVHGA